MTNVFRAYDHPSRKDVLMQLQPTGCPEKADPVSQSLRFPPVHSTSPRFERPVSLLTISAENFADKYILFHSNAVAPRSCSGARRRNS
jgi:hypothetical protein